MGCFFILNMAATTSAITQNMNNLDWYKFFSDPIVLAIVSSGIIITGVGLLFKFVFKLGGTNTTFNTAVGDIGILKTSVETIEHCITEIQTIMKQKYSRSRLNFTHSISRYGQAHSPISLKAEFRQFITDPKLDDQIKEKNTVLLKWLEKQKPATGLDAQDDIIELVTSGKISEYLKLDKYKQNLYKKGKTSEDASGILFVYLFEVLIPQLNLPNGEEKKKS